VSWLQTYSGARFDFRHPLPSLIDIEDIAHALSLQCRFNGHCTQFYSVAEHSVRCSFQVPDWCALEALLHDAAEAYVGDLVRPLKQLVGWSFQQIEQQAEQAIAKRFRLEFPWPGEVVNADMLMLAVEGRDLMGGTDHWDIALPALPPRSVLNIADPWSPDLAEQMFLQRFEELDRSRNLTPTPERTA
jgi:hypothetical protein